MNQQQFRELIEVDLRQKVIMPLMVKMGFRDVHEWHSGVMELGKDVLGWKEGELGDRVNIAVVAKATRISGTAVQEVTRQVRQAFNTPFEDPVTHTMQVVHTVWIVTNKETPSDSLPGLWADIDESKHRYVNLYDGEKLWRLWEKHFPLNLHQSLEEVQQRIAGLDTDFRVEATITPTEQQFAVSEKYPGQLETNPIELTGSFQFPKTPEGLATYEDLKIALATGSPVSIPGEYVQYAFPESMQRLIEQTIGTMPDGNWNWEISSAKNDARLPVRIDFLRDDGIDVPLPFIELQYVQSGTEEITLSNHSQAFPILVKNVVNLTNRSFTLTFSKKPGPISVHRRLDLLRLVESLSLPSNVRVTSVENGLVLSSQRQLGSNPPDYLPFEIEFTETFIAVQEKSRQPIFIPDREFTASEWKTIQLLRSVYLYPRQEGTWDEVTIEAVGKAGDEDEILTPFLLRETPFNLRSEEDFVVSLFGRDHYLGRVCTIYEEPKLANEDSARSELAAAQSEEIIIQLRLVPSKPEGRVVKEYIDWLNNADTNTE